MAQRLKIAGFWEDELGETFKKLISKDGSDNHERVRTVHDESLTESVTAKDELKEVLEPAAPGETTRETVVRAAAAAAARSFRMWRTVTTRNFANDKVALLAWVADVGAPHVFRSYDVFVAVAKRLSSRYDTLPPPDREIFEAQVAAYNRDHPE
jgi:hypothetical protein